MWKTTLIIISTYVLALLLFLAFHTCQFTKYGPIDWRLGGLLAAVNYRNGSPHTTTIEDLRNYSSGISFERRRPPGLDVQKLEYVNRHFQKLQLRVFFPQGLDMSHDLPIIMYLHGGGWISSTAASRDNVAYELCQRFGGIVCVPQYRLAPEHPFPAGLEDCYDCLVYLHKNAVVRFRGDPSKIVLAGDSAGANLAVATSMMSRDVGGPRPSAQALFYPICDVSRLDTLSYQKYGSRYFLTQDLMKMVRSYYTSGDRKLWSHPYVSPLAGGVETLKDLPPTYVYLPQFDPLFSEGHRFSKMLEEAGVPVRLKIYARIVHGFLNMPFLKESHDALKDLGEALRHQLKMTLKSRISLDSAGFGGNMNNLREVGHLYQNMIEVKGSKNDNTN